MINGSFVFGLDQDGPDVFKRTVDWAVEQSITTATFHIATPSYLARRTGGVGELNIAGEPFAFQVALSK